MNAAESRSRLLFNTGAKAPFGITENAVIDTQFLQFAKFHKASLAIRWLDCKHKASKALCFAVELSVNLFCRISIKLAVPHR